MINASQQVTGFVQHNKPTDQQLHNYGTQMTYLAHDCITVKQTIDSNMVELDRTLRNLAVSDNSNPDPDSTARQANTALNTAEENIRKALDKYNLCLEEKNKNAPSSIHTTPQITILSPTKSQQPHHHMPVLRR